MSKKKSNSVVILPKKSFPPEDAAIEYGVNTGTLANYRSKKIGPPYYKCKKRVYYKREEFEAWLYSNPVLTKDSMK